MKLTQAIQQRRTVREFSSTPIAEDVLQEILESGTWAPSHRNTQPWEFTIIGPETRKKLATAYREAMEAGPLQDPNTLEQVKQTLRKFAQNFGDAPVLLAVSSVPPSLPVDHYDFPLTLGAVIQNILLTAWEKEVAGVWTSFGANPQAKAILEIADGGLVGGILALGYPAQVPAAAPRVPLAEKTRRLP